MCDQHSPSSGCAYAQSDQSLCQPLECSMSVKRLTEHHLEFLSLKRDCTGSSESSCVKMPHCWKSRAAAQIWLMMITVSPRFERAGFLTLIVLMNVTWLLVLCVFSSLCLGLVYSVWLWHCQAIPIYFFVCSLGVWPFVAIRNYCNRLR